MILESTTPIRHDELLKLRTSPRTSGDLNPDANVEDILARSNGRRLLCIFCAEPVTDEDQRVTIEGRHAHRRTNPAGFEFEFGCFEAAPGTAAVGEATVEDTWFAGFLWRFAICRGCAAHLGWWFEGTGSKFCGLILNRLQAEQSRGE